MPEPVPSPLHLVRVDREVVVRAAAQVRRVAIADGYAGRPGQHVAFGLAAVLDEIARHVRDLDPGLRATIVQACRVVLGETPPQDAATCARGCHPALGDS